MNDKFDPYEVTHDTEARGMVHGESTAWCLEGFTLAAAKQSLFESHDLVARVVFIRHEDPTGKFHTNLPVLIDTMRAITLVPDLVEGCTAAWYFEGEFLASGYTKTRRIRIFAEFTGPEDAVGEHDRFTYQLFVAPTESRTTEEIATALSKPLYEIEYDLQRNLDVEQLTFGYDRDIRVPTLPEVQASLEAHGSSSPQPIVLMQYDHDGERDQDGCIVTVWEVPVSVHTLRRISIEDEGVVDWYLEGVTVDAVVSRYIRASTMGMYEAQPAELVDWQYVS